MRAHSMLLSAVLLATWTLGACAASEPSETNVSQPVGDGDGDGDGDAGPSVSFARDIAPLFAARCAICHVTGSPVVPYFDDPFHPEDGLIGFINTWHTAHDSPYEVIVEPGEPDASFLIYKVEVEPSEIDRANEGNAMPWQVERLTDDELSAVRQWITDGANDDAFFAENVAPIFGTEHRLGRRGGKCVYCHYEDSPTGLSVLDVFDPETGLVSVESSLSDKLRVAPGEPDESFLMEKLEEESPSAGARMPMHFPRLSEDEVATLRAWIAEGALDN
jgi:hypothetical protein